MLENMQRQTRGPLTNAGVAQVANVGAGAGGAGIPLGGSAANASRELMWQAQDPKTQAAMEEVKSSAVQP